MLWYRIFISYSEKYYTTALCFRVLNFGAIGTILGHELTHGFDIVGRMFDLHGKIKNWWSPSSLEQFQKRVECLKEQYSKFYWETAGAFVSTVFNLTQISRKREKFFSCFAA